MVKSLLIANRGEIARRIIKTAKKMGIFTVAVYSEADTNSLHIRMADKAIYIGESPPTQSYLNQKRLIDAIKITGADAVHPGYGFLSENADFVAQLEKLGINFVGPSSHSIRMMGDKIEAKKLAVAAGVNVVPGYMGAISSEKEALKIASKIGYPIMVKAAAGGGGKGIRVVRSPDDMKQAFSSARNEAQNNFADPRIFIEKYIDNPRHIEIQVLADKHGNYVCLGERECSIQRHHQKIIEEAPSSFIDERTRRKMYQQAIALAKKAGYYSAGTVEYIVDANKNFYFMEMNTRLQVEHPVTELITGIDLVEQMIRVASGEKLSFSQKDVVLNGWAFESRICAEDPSCGFLPSTGRIDTYREPDESSSVRVDSGVYEGGEVSMFYDAMIAKLCTYAPTRQQAIDEMLKALDQFVIRGVSHNISFLQAVISSKRFVAGDISTKFIDTEYAQGFSGAEITSETAAVLLCTAVFIFLADLKRCLSTSGQIRGFSNAIGTRWVVRLDENKYPVTVRPIEDGYKISFQNKRFYITSKWVLGSKLFPCKINGSQYAVQIEYLSGGFYLNYMGSKVFAAVQTPRAAELSKFIKFIGPKDQQSNLVSNISGLVVDVKVQQNESVTKGQPLVVVEAMKMENILIAPRSGRVASIAIKAGQIVTSGELLIEIVDE
ncbi:MAG: acetyl/propionyl/methylcrotonyl-CoA carboxylase subunit alpha [Proteobacteria bacterium]|nr:acetyl/propionyl/methylcrotonyl-CoA carboxylase subunit alpha [Pseudomonadota bacterium]